MPDLDLFIYRDFDSADVDLHIGDDAEAKLGSGFNGFHVVATAPPVHEGKDKTVVLVAEHRPERMQPLREFFSRGPIAAEDLSALELMRELARLDPSYAPGLKELEDEGLIPPEDD